VPIGPAISDWKKRAFDAQRDGLFQNKAGALAWLQEERDAALLVVAGATASGEGAHDTHDG
jgi:hypothetical protein